MINGVSRRADSWIRYPKMSNTGDFGKVTYGFGRAKPNIHSYGIFKLMIIHSWKEINWLNCCPVACCNLSQGRQATDFPANLPDKVAPHICRELGHSDMLLEAQILPSDIDWFGLVCTLDKLGCTKLGYRGLNDIASYEMTKPPHVDTKQPSPLLHFLESQLLYFLELFWRMVRILMMALRSHMSCLMHVTLHWIYYLPPPPYPF